MKILAIESSCDETAAAIVENGTNILSNVVISQIDIFAEYGGVIPEVAARSHLEAIMPVVHKALQDARSDWGDIDAIAVTHTPGLLGSLLVGTLTARTLAILHNKPFYAVHHLKSHIYANWLETPNQDQPKFPVLSLVISGGHTQILYMKAHNHFEIIGTSHDDAVGECFDKVAKILGLPYPGGPSIAKVAQNGDRKKYQFPHPKVENLDFSFSGLKTAVLRRVQKELGLPISFPSHELASKLTEKQVADFAASFEQTAIEILLEKLKLAQTIYPAESIVIAGGVSANTLLRETAKKQFEHVSFPKPEFSGDNAAMVGAACYYEIESGVQPSDPYHLNILPRSEIK
ncbi:tRNA (adenosine(37)-N6)-threonylcarbamoyltransferase complex transferase subunit TsaD [Candidatus Saccharibacteria bacterium]|nr:tRNA (adenosine(37)-N6)-threonylcarbamoyltransferase complex transferase subunit TsaD [Candidatus Saccharibacteria bacterium]